VPCLWHCCPAGRHTAPSTVLLRLNAMDRRTDGRINLFSPYSYRIEITCSGPGKPYHVTTCRSAFNLRHITCTRNAAPSSQYLLPCCILHLPRIIPSGLMFFYNVLWVILDRGMIHCKSCLHRKTRHSKTRTCIHAPNGTRTRDPSVRATHNCVT
jgi:hypothetical protein